jgi:hypothetical protein
VRRIRVSSPGDLPILTSTDAAGHIASAAFIALVADLALGG